MTNCVCMYLTFICFSSKIWLNLQFLCNTIKNMITFKPGKHTNYNLLLLCCLIVKLTSIVYKNISYGNHAFTDYNCSKWMNRFGTNSQNTEFVSVHTFSSETMAEFSFSVYRGFKSTCSVINANCIVFRSAQLATNLGNKNPNNFFLIS